MPERHIEPMQRCSWLVACVGVLALCAYAVSAKSQATATPAMPESPDKQLVMKHCVACHGLDRILNAGGTARGWNERIQRMNRWGAKVPPGDVGPLVRFLAATLPPRVRLPTQGSLMLDTSVSSVALHPIQSIVRTAADLAPDGTLVVTGLPNGSAEMLQVGQRARVFTPDTRQLSRQARVVHVEGHDEHRKATVALSGSPASTASRYLVEIVVERGSFLCVPNEAVIEDGGQHIVYLRVAADDYVPRSIQVGFNGERYTQVLAGLKSGDEVVTLGGFFVDAQYRMRAADP